MKGTIGKILRVGLPLVLGAGILWWMYRGFQWQDIRKAVEVDMRWGWMLLSLPFGIIAQVLRGLRWRQMLEPMGEQPRRWTCVNSIFLSYGSSLVVPRVGEVLRCGVLSHYEGTRMSHALGTVVTERIVDVVLILLLTVVTVLTQIPVFLHFMNRTGMSLQGILSGFTTTGYVVTVLCGLTVLATAWYILRRFHVFDRSSQAFSGLKDGLLSIRNVRRKWLFWGYSFGLWVCYYLHFYLTFYCFSFTEHLGPVEALVTFVLFTYAVLVPTPNGAGPWHFATKTALMLYGVPGNLGAMFALIVHTIQTGLVAVLGLVGAAGLVMTGNRRKV
ncbi:MAG: flippase-like domain-containing protein [Bacteroidaceae bacterium]|nr:flippase-like domain-containing protein [Bacteroidaceae bacterium]